MTRTYSDKWTPGSWAMVCDRCNYRSDSRPSHDDLPLQEFVDEGWFVGKLSGDRCPGCVALTGGMEAITTEPWAPR